MTIKELLHFSFGFLMADLSLVKKNPLFEGRMSQVAQDIIQTMSAEGLRLSNANDPQRQSKRIALFMGGIILALNEDNELFNGLLYPFDTVQKALIDKENAPLLEQMLAVGNEALKNLPESFNSALFKEDISDPSSYFPALKHGASIELIVAFCTLHKQDLDNESVSIDTLIPHVDERPYRCTIKDHLVIRNNLKPLTLSYLNYLEATKKNIKPQNAELLQGKIDYVSILLECLEDKNLTTFYSTLDKFISKELKMHRDPEWKRYVKVVLVILGFIAGVIPGLLALGYYVNKTEKEGKSLRFWKSHGEEFVEKIELIKRLSEVEEDLSEEQFNQNSLSF